MAGQGIALAAAAIPTPPAPPMPPPSNAIPVFSTVDELLAADLKLDAATVAVPTVHHHAVAAALRLRARFAREKPLAATLAEATI